MNPSLQECISSVGGIRRDIKLFVQLLESFYRTEEGVVSAGNGFRAKVVEPLPLVLAVALILALELDKATLRAVVPN